MLADEVRDRRTEPVVQRDEGATQQWLDEWVHGVSGRAEYLAKLGEERVASLRPSAPAPSGVVDYGEYR